MKKYLISLLALATLSVMSCKQEFENPNAATDVQVFSTPKGITGVVVGLQRIYCLARNSPMYCNITAGGALTNEYRILNAGNTDENDLFIGGGQVTNLNGILNNMWSQCNKIIYEADRAIAAAKLLGDKNYAAGLIAHASIFKAMSIGLMANYWENVPATPGTTTASAAFQTRTDAYKRAVTVLNDALTEITANAPNAAFLANVPTGINYVNSINALKARYNLFAGDYTAALASANLVDLTSKSELKYDALSVNPIFETPVATNNVYQVLDSTLGLPAGFEPNLADRRVAFYTSINAAIAPRFRINGFFNSVSASIPVYLPGEMTLIKAECYLRQASPSTSSAQVELDKVLTKLPAADPFGVGAGLPAYAGPLTVADMLNEVYKNRCIECYMSGMRLVDSRRFARPQTERKRNYFPYPFRERDNNTNTPADPPL
jgi:starch-binding outer membrane protein, SusD/RagB family